MLQHYSGNRPRKIYTSQDFISIPGMSLNESKLNVRQHGRFAEDFNRYGYLAQIVNHPSHTNSHRLIFWQVHFRCYGEGQPGYPLLMTSRVRVPCFDCPGHCLDDSLQGPLQTDGALFHNVFKLLAVHSVDDLQFPSAEDIVDIDDQFIRVKGFKDVAICP